MHQRSKLELDKKLIVFYQEGCEAVRHYSAIIAQVRNLAIVQGLVVLGVASYLVKDNDYYLSIPVHIFGLSLTFILASMHSNYYKHFGEILNGVVELEKMTSGSEQTIGVWSRYKKGREIRAKKEARKIILHFGPLLLLYLAFVFLFTFTILKFLK